jgi:hypothetical protein
MPFDQLDAKSRRIKRNERGSRCKHHEQIFNISQTFNLNLLVTHRNRLKINTVKSILVILFEHPNHAMGAAPLKREGSSPRPPLRSPRT